MLRLTPLLAPTFASAALGAAQTTWIVDDDPGPGVHFATPQDALLVAVHTSGMIRFSLPGEVQVASSVGGAVLPVHFSAHPATWAGQTWTFPRAWYRDAVSGATTSNLTSAVRIALQ